MSIQQDVAQAIANDPGVVMLLGAPDRGKTSWCLRLANELVRMGRRVALVDADIGQSDLGPPATMAMSHVGQELAAWQELRPQASFFVGTTSPPGAEGWCVAGVTRMVQAARKGSDVVLVDTTGLVSGPHGRHLKGAKLEALLPRHVVAVEQQHELAVLLKGWPVPPERVWRVPSPRGMKRRDALLRRELRQAAFKRYWHSAEARRLQVKGLGRWRTRWGSGTPLSARERETYQERYREELVYAEENDQGIWAVTKAVHKPRRTPGVFWAQGSSFCNLLVAVVGEDPDAITVGTLEEVNWDTGEVALFSPPFDDLTGLIFGFMRVDRSGRELGRLRPEDI